jgi:hypothetical protein
MFYPLTLASELGHLWFFEKMASEQLAKQADDSQRPQPYANLNDLG